MIRHLYSLLTYFVEKTPVSTNSFSHSLLLMYFLTTLSPADESAFSNSDNPKPEIPLSIVVCIPIITPDYISTMKALNKAIIRPLFIMYQSIDHYR